MLTQVRYAAAVVLVLVLASAGLSWTNGPAGNANTNLASECANPRYATHDWIADHALVQLPQEERAWLEPFKSVYLLGTEWTAAAYPLHEHSWQPIHVYATAGECLTIARGEVK
jgi:hypothetical protein